MHNLKFDKLFPIAPWTSLADRRYVFECCNTAADAYREEIGMTHSLGMIPGYAFMNGELWRDSVLHGMKEVGTDNPDDSAVHVAAVTYFDSYDTKKFDEKEIKRFHEGTQSAANIASIEGRTYSHGALHLLMKAIIIQAWTGFEKLAGKMANETRKKHAECFGQIGVDPSKYLNVKSMDGLEKSFKAAFGNDQSICGIITSKEIKALGILRHLLVHQNGVVDQRHLDQRSLAPIVTSFDSFSLNTEILLDGPMVRSLVDPVTKQAYALIGLVDAWLVAHKPV